MRYATMGTMCVMTLVGAALFAAPTATKLSSEERAARKAARQQEFLKATGGRLKDTRQQKGSFVIIDAQKKANRAWAEAIAQYINEAVKISAVVKAGSLDGMPASATPTSPTLYLIDDASMPSILVAPEQFWVVVNVALIASEKPAFFEARVKKQIIRAFAILCGAPMSGYDNPLTAPVLKVDDLDEMIDYSLPADIRGRCQKYLTKCGVTQYKMSTYYDACEQGWAPAPTNDYQKAIWDDKRKIPEKPMKIEFDPKKGK